MNDQPEHGPPAGATGRPSTDSLCQQFEAAWEAVRDGEDGPKIELYLLAVEAPERPGLEQRLRQIAAETGFYRPLVAHYAQGGDRPRPLTATEGH